MSIYKVLNSLQDIEDVKTQNLFSRMDEVRETGYLERELLLDILKWKSPRPLKHYLLNKPEEIKMITKVAFGIENDFLKMHTLTALIGVNYPAASAILMFFDPKIFAVLDIRVWKQLYKLGLVNENPNGQNFNAPQCDMYLTTIRGLAKELNITARQVEKRLFDYDKINQVGTLYKSYQKIKI